MELWSDLVAWWFDGYMPSTTLAVMVAHVGVWFTRGAWSKYRTVDT